MLWKFLRHIFFSESQLCGGVETCGNALKRYFGRVAVWIILVMSAVALTAAGSRPLSAAPLAWSYPAGGETLAAGSTVQLQWSGGDPGKNVVIHLIDVDAWQIAHLVTPSGTTTPNDGEFTWTVPSALPNGGPPRDYQLYIQDVAPTTTWSYGGQFTIVPANTGTNGGTGTTQGSGTGEPRPNDLDFATEHFQCYDIAERPGLDLPVKLVDQFGASENIVVRPKYLCAPVDKNGEGMRNETDHLMLYELENPVPAGKVVEITNQFGTERYEVLGARLIAVPSLKKVIEPKGEIDFGIEKAKGVPLGKMVPYTIQVDNHGAPLDVPPAVLSVVDHVPVGMVVTFSPNSDWACPSAPVTGPANATCTWSGATPVPSGNLPPIPLFALRQDDVPYKNCAEVVVDGGAADIHPADNESGDCDEKDDDDGDDTADLEIEKNALQPVCEAGQTCAFEVIIRNNGTGDWTGPLSIDDYSVPASNAPLQSIVLSGTSAGWNPPPVPAPTCTLPAALPLSCTLSLTTIPAGEWVSYTFTFDVPPFAAAAQGQNCVELISQGQKLGASCATVTISPREQEVDLGIDKALLPGVADPYPGGLASFEITVTNAGGPIPAGTQITVQDLLPPGFTLQGVSNGPWSCSPIGGNNFFSCTYTTSSPLPSGWTSSFIVDTQIATTAQDGDQCAGVEVPGPLVDIEPANDLACVYVELVTSPFGKFDLGIEKVLTGGSLVQGSVATFEITVINNGGPLPPGAQISVQDTLPPGFTVLSAGGGSWTCAPPSGNSFSCTYTGTGSLAGGGSSALLVEVEIGQQSPGGNQCATVAVAPPYTDLVPANDTACVAVPVSSGQTDLTIEKTADQPICLSGQSCEFSVTVTNTGQTDSSGLLAIRDFTTPAGGVIQSIGAAATSAGWGSAPVPALQCGILPSQTPVTCQLTPATIPAGQSVTYAISFDVPDGAGPITGENCAELLGANNQVLSQSCASVNVQEYALDIAVEKTMAPGAAAPVAGGTTAFTIEVQNVGQFQIPAGAEITMTDSLPSGFTFSGLAGGSGLWVCGPAGSNNVTCTYGPASSPLPPGWSSSLTINAAIDVNATGGAQCASIGLLPGPDGFPSNDTSCIAVSVGRSKPADADGAESERFACVSGLRSASSSLNLREGPAGNARVVASLRQGTPLLVLGEDGAWFRVRTLGAGPTQEGWVSGRYTRNVRNASQCSVFSIAPVIPAQPPTTGPTPKPDGDGGTSIEIVPGLTIEIRP